MKKITIFIVALNIVLMLLRLHVGDPTTFYGDIFSLVVFAVILGSLGTFFLMGKHDYFLMTWISFFFACPIIILPFTSIGSLGILNAIFIPLMLWKTFDLKNKYYLTILGVIMLSLLNMADVDARIIISRIFAFISLFLFYQYSKRYIKDPEKIFDAIILVALVNVPLGLYEIFFQPGWGVFSDWRGFRIFGNLFWPNSYTTYLLPVLILLYHRLRKKMDVMTAIQFAILMIMNIFTFSRAGLLCTGIGLLMYEVFKTRVTAFKAIFSILAMTFCLLLVGVVYEEISPRFTTDSLVERTAIWETVLPFIEGNYVFGNGLGSYELYRARVMGGHSTHNVYLGILFELGIVGLALILLLIAIMIMSMKKDPVAISIMISFIVYSFVGGAAFTQVVALHAWIMFGALYIAKKKNIIHTS